MVTSHITSKQKREKNVVIASTAAFLFGPLGLLYTSVRSAVVLTAVAALGFFFLRGASAWGLFGGVWAFSLVVSTVSALGITVANAVGFSA